MTFSLTGEADEETIDVVDLFKWLGRPLDRSDKDWQAVRRNIWKARHICEQLGKLLMWKGADLIISATFYRTVVQAVIIFGEYTWFLMSSMEKRIEGLHTGFLRQVAGKKQGISGIVTGGRRGRTAYCRRWGRNRWERTLTKVRWKWWSGCPPSLFLRCAHRIRGTREGEGYGRRGGGRRWQTTIWGPC